MGFYGILILCFDRLCCSYCSYQSFVYTDPLFLPILCSYCSYWSSVPTDPTVTTDPLFVPILCSYWSYCYYRSSVRTDPLFLLFLLFPPILSVPTDSTDPTVPTDPLFLYTDPLFLLILCSYWFSVPADPVILLILCSYCSSVPTTDPFSLRCQSVSLWRQSGRRTPAISRNSRWVITTCNSPLVHLPKSTLFAPKILHKHCFQFFLGRL